MTMKVSRLTHTDPAVGLTGSLTGGGGSIGPSGQVPTSNGSNTVSWGSNVATVFSNGSNLLTGPTINLASGSNITFTLDSGPGGASGSNTLRIHTSAALLSSIGSGDPQHIYWPTTAQLVGVREGTDAAGDPDVHPLVKVERTLQVADSSLMGKGDGAEQMSALMGVSVGSNTTRAQVVGIFAGAKHSGMTNGSESRRPDAAALYAVARIFGTGTGTAIAGFFNARRDNNTGNASGLEVHVQNLGTAGSYSSTGFPTLGAIWVNCSGDADSGAAIVVSNAFGRQFKVGLGFTAQVVGALTGGVADSSIRDDSSSTISLDIRGTHTYGLDLMNGTYTAAIRLPNSATGAGGIFARNSAGSADHSVIYYNNSNNVVIGAQASGIFMSTLMTMANAANIGFSTSTGSKIGTATTQKIGFWNATPVVQPTNIVDADGTLADITTKFNSLLTKLETIGILAA